MKKYVRYLLVLLMCGSLTGVKAQKTFQVDGINYYLDGSEARVSDNRDYSGSKIIIPNSVLYDGKNYPVTSIADSDRGDHTQFRDKYWKLCISQLQRFDSNNDTQFRNDYRGLCISQLQRLNNGDHTQCRDKY